MTPGLSSGVTSMHRPFRLCMRRTKSEAVGLYSMIQSMKYTGDWAGMFAAVIIVFLPKGVIDSLRGLSLRKPQARQQQEVAGDVPSA